MTALKPLGWQNDSLTQQPLGLTNLSWGRRSPLGVSAATLGQTFPVVQLSLAQIDRFSQDPTFYDEFDFTSTQVNAGTAGSSAPPASPAPTQDFAPATPPIQTQSEPNAPTTPTIPPTATPSTAEITEILSPSITRLPLAPPVPLGNRLPLTLPEPTTPESAAGSDQAEPQESVAPLPKSSETPAQFDPIQRSLTADRSDDLSDVTGAPLPTAAIASDSIEHPAATSAPPALDPQTASAPPLQLEAITAESVDQLADEPVDQSVNLPVEPATLTTSATQVSATETSPIARSPGVVPPEIAVSSPEALPAVSAASGPTEPLQPIVEPGVAESPRPTTPSIQAQGDVTAPTEPRAPEAGILHDEITAIPTADEPTVPATSSDPIVRADSPVHVTRLPAPLDTTPDTIQPNSDPEPRLEETSVTPAIAASPDLPRQAETLPATDVNNRSDIHPMNI
jgi:hypothetical protein